MIGRPCVDPDPDVIAARVRGEMLDRQGRRTVESDGEEPQYPTDADGNVIPRCQADAIDAIAQPSYWRRLSLELTRATQAVAAAFAEALDPQPRLIAADPGPVEAPPIEDRAPPGALRRAQPITAHAPPVRAFEDPLAVRTRAA
jgi:hypothetical protein